MSHGLTLDCDRRSLRSLKLDLRLRFLNVEDAIRACQAIPKDLTIDIRITYVLQINI